MEFHQTLLPGVGVRYDATTRAGSPISVVIGRDGDAELVAYKRDDPDSVAHSLRLGPTEVAALAEILGSPRVSARVADLTKEVPGLSSARFVITPGSRYDGRRLGDSKARTRTGCSIVAVVRGQHVYAAPGPERCSWPATRWSRSDRTRVWPIWAPSLRCRPRTNRSRCRTSSTDVMDHH